jgi:hypothetical protein
MAEQGKRIAREVQVYAAPNMGKLEAARNPRQLKKIRPRDAA